MTLDVSEKQAVRFERGFKTWSENTAVSVRDRLGLRNVDPISPVNLANYLGVHLWTLSDVPGLPAASLAHLSSSEGDEWSAVTVRISQVDVIVVNSTHTAARQASDLAHELAHLIRQHKPAQVFIVEQTSIGIRTFDPLQEAEANWLAGCLLLPRIALAHYASRGMSRVDLGEHYGVSDELVRYRLNVTGIGKQFGIA